MSDESIIQGDMPENAVPVHSFAVGYGEVAAADEEGVTALPMVTILTNDGHGPMLLFSLDATVRLVGELSQAVPKSVARFDPKFAETLEKADDIIARTKRAQRRSDRAFLLSYLAALGIVLLFSAIAHNLTYAADLVEWVLSLVGVTYLLKLLVIEFAEWRNARDRKRRRGK